MAARTCEICGKETTGRKHCDTCRSRAFREKNPSYHRDYWRDLSPEVRAQALKNIPARAARNQEALAAAKERPCADCGGTFPPECMDLDHVPERGPKLFRLAQMATRSLEAVLAEIAKCDPVCANCHRTRTRSRAKGTGMC
jgi:hypothetical protein